MGPPLHESFQRFCGFTEEEALQKLDVFREYYVATGIYENSVYPGIVPTLKKLRDAGLRLAVATSKPDLAAEWVLEHFNLSQYFEVLSAASMDNSLCRKADVIARALEKMEIQDKSTCLMVGDREYDIKGAAECGLDSMGVLYGYGDREELTKAGALILVESPEEIAEYILRLHT